MIRPLTMTADLDRVTQFYIDAPDYWQTAEGCAPGVEKAKEFFEDIPPKCNPDYAHRLGLFLDQRLSGIADLFFGFPEFDDAYIGLMLLGPWARNQGSGKRLLSNLENLARAGSAKQICLAVMTINPRGRAFWEREGFLATGLSGTRTFGKYQHELHRLAKPL